MGRILLTKETVTVRETMMMLFVVCTVCFLQQTTMAQSDVPQLSFVPGITAETFTETDTVHAGSTFRAAIVANLNSGWHINAHEPKDPYLVPTTLTFSPLTGFTIQQTAYPVPVTVTLEGSQTPLQVYEKKFNMGVSVAVSEEVVPGDYVLHGALRYQACDNKQCFPPQKLAVQIAVKVVAKETAITPQHADLFAGLSFTDTAPAEGASAVKTVNGASPVADDWHALMDQFTVAGTANGYLGTDAFLAFLDGAESGVASVVEGGFAEKSIWWVLFLVLGGGLLLNLTPCVLPLIPINLAILGAGAKAGSRMRGFLLGGVYGLGIALAYGTLGVLVVLGLSETFGGINASPWFNGAIAILFVVLALAMFDMFLIDFTRYQGKLGVHKKGGFLAAFVMGAISALLAGACVAPVLISTLLYAQDQYAQGRILALFLPFLLGLGMALPWPFAGAGLSFLPKPGRWMARVKQAFGVLILGFAVYYGHLAYSLSNEREVIDHAGDIAVEGDWQTKLAPAFKASLQSGKPVLVDFWATWCKNCLVMNATTLKDPRVTERLKQYTLVKFQAEDPSDSATGDVMKRFEVIGLPAYIVLKPKQSPPATP